jgi:hypothetical protein
VEKLQTDQNTGPIMETVDLEIEGGEIQKEHRGATTNRRERIVLTIQLMHS